MKSNKLKLIYIAGYSRCGSTILSNILGEIDSFFNAGEVMYIWDRIISENGICGCGSHVCQCNVWSNILEEAFGINKQIDCRQMIRLRNSEWQSIKIPFWMWVSAIRKKLLSKMQEYLANLGKLYSAMGSVLSDNVIIDSSKNPAYLYMLSRISEVDIYIVHIIRDPRATAYSWLNKKTGFAQISSWKSSLSWDIRNSCCDLFRREYGKKYLRIKYEDLMADPKKAVNSILEMAGESPKRLDFLKNNEIELGQNHCVFGNTDLFKTGVVKLCLDQRWKNMKERDKIITTAITLPLIYRYGYSIYSD